MQILGIKACFLTSETVLRAYEKTKDEWNKIVLL